MGNENSKGSSVVPGKPEAHQAKPEGDLGEQPARKPSSDPGNETVEATSDPGNETVETTSDPGNETAEAHTDEGSASQTRPQQEEEVSSFSSPAEEPGPQELQSPSLSQSAASDKGPELETTAENLHRLAESPAQKSPDETSPCSPPEKEPCSERCDSDDASFEIILEDHPGRGASETVEGHSDRTAPLAAEWLEAQSSAEVELSTAETVKADFRKGNVAPLPAAGTQVGQNKGHSAVDTRTSKGGKGQAASEIPEEAVRESPLARRAPGTLEEPPASNAVKHADTKPDMKLTDGARNDGSYLTTKAVSLGAEHPATVTVCDVEVEPLPDHPTEPSSKLPQDLDEAKELELSLVKAVEDICSGLDAIEMADALVSKHDKCPQSVHVSCTEVTLAPTAHETQPVATADVNAPLQGSSGSQKDSAESLAHVHSKEARFPKTFYLCCSQCSIGDGEANAEE